MPYFPILTAIVLVSGFGATLRALGAGQQRRVSLFLAGCTTSQLGMAMLSNLVFAPGFLQTTMVVAFTVGAMLTLGVELRLDASRKA